MKTTKLLLAVLTFNFMNFLTFNSFAARLVINDNAYIHIKNGAYLVIDDSTANGITTTGTGGRIVSEADTNYVKWNIRRSTGSFIIPFSFTDGTKIPFTFRVTSAGTGAGNLTASTYYTNVAANPNNRPLPQGVTNLNNGSGSENDVFVTDRFWRTKLNEYSANPTADLTFKYRNAEWDASGGSRNTLTEANLQAQRWNSATSQWESPVGSVSVTADTVGVTAINAFEIWALVDNSSPLPITLLNFDAEWADNSYHKVRLTWTTLSEINNASFTIQRSDDATYFRDIQTLQGAGNSNKILTYTDFDHQPEPKITNYYRLKQTDFDGNSTFSTIDFVTPKGIDIISLFPIPATENIRFIVTTNENTEIEINVLDATGRTIYTETQKVYREKENTYNIQTEHLSAGSYMLQIQTTNGMYQKYKQFLLK